MTSSEVATGLYLRPCSGEIVSGDCGVIVPQENGVFLAIADVLGHGDNAHALAEVIEQFLTTHAGPDLIEPMQLLHTQLKGTLGAAVAVAYLDWATGEMRYVGVGNTRCRRFGSADTRLVSRDGTVGMHMPTLGEECVKLRAGDLVILFSDGVRERFGEEEYPGLLGDNPPIVARLVVQRFGKEYDDATCLALRYEP